MLKSILKKNITILSMGLFIILGFVLFNSSIVNAEHHSSHSGIGGGYAGGDSNLLGAYKTPFLWIIQRGTDDPNGPLSQNGWTLRSQLSKGPKEKYLGDERPEAVAFISLNVYNGWHRAPSVSYSNYNKYGFRSHGNVFNTWAPWAALSGIEWITRDPVYVLGTARGNLPGVDYSSYVLPDDFVAQAKEYGYKVYCNNRWGCYNNVLYYRGAEYLDQVSYVGWHAKSKSTIETKIVKQVCGKNDNCKPFDYTGWNPKDIYSKAPTEVLYSYVSKEGEFDYIHDLTYTVYVVKKIETWEEKRDGSTRNYKEEYKVIQRTTTTNRAKWEAERPVIESKFYKPYDLYTEQQIPDTDAKQIFSGDRLKYLSNDPLKLTVDNLIDQDMNSSEKYLTTIDDNGRLSWDLKFHNDQFGIPTKAEGGIDITKDHKDLSQVGLYNTQYYNPIFHLSSSNMNNNYTSVQFKTKEIEGNSEILQYYGDRGGRYNFRSIKTGEYKISSKIFDDYWSVIYQGSQYFKYGSKYSGKVYVCGTGKACWTPTDNNKIKVEDNKIYTGEDKVSFTQPILRGKIKVKTVGGYNP